MALAALAVWKGPIEPAAASGSDSHGRLDAPAAPLLNASLAASENSIDPTTASSSGGQGRLDAPAAPLLNAPEGSIDPTTPTSDSDGHGMLTTDPPSAGGFNCLGSVAPADILDALPSPQCLAAIGAACDAARGSSSDACLACAGNRASDLKRSGCAPEDLGTFCVPRRKLRVENQLPHPVWMEELSCDPLQVDPTCKGAYPGLRKPDGASVPVSICKIPSGHVLSFPIPTGAEIDSFKIYPKWGCDESGEDCTSHQELPPYTAYEGSFNVPQPAAPSDEPYVHGTRGWAHQGAAGATWCKDFIDISAVDGLTIDFIF